MSFDTFEALSLAEPLHRALRDQDYHTPSPIQAQAIPLLLEGHDLLGCAQTGTGKTAAFALPILHKIVAEPRRLQPNTARALVLTPTRELAVQVADSFAKYGRYVRFSQTLVYGGVSQKPQVRALQRGVDVLVATPGRLLDLHGQGHIDLGATEFFVLDEVDRMLDMGFIHDVRKVVKALPTKRQSLFFSATVSSDIRELSETILTEPKKVSVAPETTTAENIDHKICFIERSDKSQLLSMLLEQQAGVRGENLTLVFSRTKHGANKLAKNLDRIGIRADAIHGNKSQAARERSLARFRKGAVPVLVATDVAARGIDVRNITLVINYDMPMEPDSYVHRIGRTARAGAEGRAISFCTSDELGKLRDIERLIKQQIDAYKDNPFHDADVESRHRRHQTLNTSKRSKKFGGQPRRRRQPRRSAERLGSIGGRRRKLSPVITSPAPFVTATRCSWAGSAARAQVEGGANRMFARPPRPLRGGR